MFFEFLCFLFVISLLKMTPQFNVEVFSSVPKNKKAVVFSQKQCVF